jgi:hypothetical protein
MLEAGVPSSDCILDQLADDRSALGAQSTIGAPLYGLGEIAHDETADAAIANQDVGPKPEHEIRNGELTSSGNG